MSIDHYGCLVIADDMFDVGSVPFEQSPEAAISCGAAVASHSVAAINRGVAAISRRAAAGSRGAAGRALVVISLK